MSWDAVILKIEGPAKPVEEVEDGDFLPIGDTESVAERIRAAFPDAEWDTPTWARWGVDEYTGMTIDLSGVESTKAIFVSVSGSGNPIPHLLALAAANDWVVMDVGTGEFLSEDDVESDGWEGYQELLGGLRRDLRAVVGPLCHSRLDAAGCRRAANRPRPRVIHRHTEDSALPTPGVPS